MTADLHDLFDQAGRNPPGQAWDADAVRRRARRSRNRAAGVVAATVALALAVAVGLATQGHPSEDPVPADDLPTPPPASLGPLAFGIDGDLYVADGDGRNRVRIADGAPDEAGECRGYWGEGSIWSPDGRYLAYRGNGESTSRTCDRTVNISDSSGRRLASFPAEGWAIAWSPDSTRVAVWDDFDAVWSPDGASLLVPPDAEIPVDGSSPRLLAASDPGSQWMATYSPSGAEIAYISSEGLAVADADGSAARVLVPGGPEDFPVTLSGLEWSPTGDRIVFELRATGESTDRGGASELTLLDVASGRVEPLADLDGTDVSETIEFSPEGDQVLFTATGAAGGSLWRVHTDGSGLRRLVTGSDWGDWQAIPTRGDEMSD